jgi:hypothetical protein
MSAAVVASPTPTAIPTPAVLAIVSPSDGAVVSEPTVVVSGTAPAGARVVRDVPLGFDASVTADASGAWTMAVKLDEGPNGFVFRIGDDKSTSVHLSVTYQRPVATLIATTEPTTVATTASTPLATTQPTPIPTTQPTPDVAPAPTPPVEVKTYATPTDRQWEQIVKSPDNYIGNGYHIWACIAQFDAATGADTFRGYASNKQQEYWYLDGVNSLFWGSDAQLSDFVTDDLVAMNVTSFGSLSYDTQIGGNTTVPFFLVDSIAHKGSCN